MHNLGFFIVIILFGLPALIVGGFFLIWALKIISGDRKGRDAEIQAEETRLIQELHQGFLRMEDRIETLETILLDHDRPERKEHEQ